MKAERIAYAMLRHLAEMVPSGPDRRSEVRPGAYDRRAVARAVRRVANDPALAGDVAPLDWDGIADELAKARYGKESRV